VVILAGSFLLLNCKENQEKDVIAQLKRMPEVKEIQCVTGPYDILVRVETSTLKQLHETITWKIRKISNVRSTYSLKINEEATDCKDGS